MPKMYTDQRECKEGNTNTVLSYGRRRRKRPATVAISNGDSHPLRRTLSSLKGLARERAFVCGFANRESAYLLRSRRFSGAEADEPELPAEVREARIDSVDCSEEYNAPTRPMMTMAI